MFKIRKSENRGKANHGWLDTRFSFSFAEYYDPENMGYRSLRVINEDTIAPDGGFPLHPHDNMEIVTYIIEGELEHKDSMGTGSVVKAGDVQRMTAGSGVRHSEFNPSSENPTHLLQIWILPEEQNLEPSYEQKNFSREQKLNQLTLMAAPIKSNEAQDAIKIHQDVYLYSSVLEKNKSLIWKLKENRYAWIQMVSGALKVNEETIHAGDGLSITNEPNDLKFESLEDSTEFLLFDLN